MEPEDATEEVEPPTAPAREESPPEAPPRPARARRLLRWAGGAALGLVALIMGTHLMEEPWRRLGHADDRSRVDLDELETYARLAELAYEDDEVVRDQLDTEVAIERFPESGLRVLIWREAGASFHWVAVRGTANLNNMVEDAEFVALVDHGLKVHTGFDQAAREALPWIQEQLPAGARVRIAGHSLGGAVAVLLAAALEVDGVHVERVITFGQPKVTDAAGVRRLRNLPLLRVLHHTDPVPLLPPVNPMSALVGPYRHVGPEVIFRSTGHFWVLDQHDSERLDVTSLWRQLGHVHPDDHLITSYQEALAAARTHVPEAGSS